MSENQEYLKREFCKDIKCPVQIDLNKQKKGSKEYEEIREKCKKSCIKTAYEFHDWLIKNRFIIMKKE